MSAILKISPSLVRGMIDVRFPFCESLQTIIKAWPGSTWRSNLRCWAVDKAFVADLKRLAPKFGFSAVNECYCPCPVGDTKDPSHVPLHVFQQQAIDRAHINRSLMLAFEMGLGKTRTAIESCKFEGCNRILVVCPAIARQVWCDERVKWWSSGPEAVVLWPGQKSIVVPTKAAMLITSYELLHKVFAAYPDGWDAIILDECFVAGTKIATPKGAVDIEDLVVGDEVYAYNEATGHYSAERVECTSAKTTDVVVDIMVNNQYITCSTNHPFLTNYGWVPAGDLHDGDFIVCSMQKELSAPKVLREKILQQEMLESWERACDKRSAEISAQTQSLAGLQKCGKNENKQPDVYEAVQTASGGKSPQAYCGGLEAVWDSGAYGKREDCPRAEEVSAVSRMDDGVCSSDRASSHTRNPNMLQNRHSSPTEKSSNRSRREYAQQPISATARQQKRSVFAETRLARITRVKRRCIESNSKDSTLYNLQISGPSTYILAETGAVVHNCHYISHGGPSGAKRTALCHELRKRNPKSIRIGLTGTPVMTEPKQLHAQMEFLWPTRFGYWTKFTERYCNVESTGFVTASGKDAKRVFGLNSLYAPELESRLADCLARATKAEYAHLLPPLTTQTLRVDVPKSFDPRELIEQFMRMDAHKIDTEDFVRQHSNHKIGTVAELAVEAAQGSSRVAVMTYLHRTAYAIADEIKRLHGEAQVFTGEVVAKERIAAINECASNGSREIAVISMSSVRESVDLTAFSTVFFAELHPSPGLCSQVAGRFHRLSSKLPVNIYIVIINGSYEELVASKLTARLNDSASLYKPGMGEEKMIDAFTDKRSDEEFRDHLSQLLKGAPDVL